ncbi:hypothetical protein GBAR_LOCUS30271 [Geodia barretti]|uniref:Uncharacterized protein n=1 Tax=Geodia barretti TaxID=519541 RepID=A0AA35TVV2_GEOBA|nr:hypothetical protein GBAR_LOCUS30271 [Geodia barretti]
MSTILRSESSHHTMSGRRSVATRKCVGSQVGKYGLTGGKRFLQEWHHGRALNLRPSRAALHVLRT